jgi:protoheme IX farnesyltransferase
MSLASRGISPPGVGRAVRLRRSHAGIGDLFALMKPRVMSLVVFTALVGLLIAPGQLDPVRGCVAVLCIAIGAGGAGALNMWYDADIDKIMTRTATRPIPSGRVLRSEALIFGIVLSTSAVLALGVVLNLTAAGLLLFTVFFYVVVYTIWLKRRTAQNIVIGGAAGALPPAIGWVAATGHIGAEPLVLFLIIFLWTPAHFWALSLNHADEYARAGIPMLPVVAGRAETKKQILIYSLLSLLISVMPWMLGFAGPIYGVTAAILAATMTLFALRLYRSQGPHEAKSAGQMFAFSIVYLFLIFSLLLADAAMARVGTL